eukprot:PhF_6_TR11188/c0_g1_i1/m.18029
MSKGFFTPQFKQRQSGQPEIHPSDMSLSSEREHSWAIPQPNSMSLTDSMSSLSIHAPLPVDVNGTHVHPPNVPKVFDIYTSNWSLHMKVPNHLIIPTLGSVNYAQQSQEGRHPTMRFQQCNAFTARSCRRGAECPYIHSAHTDMDVASGAVSMSYVHVNYALPSVEHALYATHPPGGVLAVQEPNRAQSIHHIPTERVYCTAGSAALIASGQKPDTVVKFCAHYYLKKMCHMGERCQFIHAVFLSPQAPQK